MQIEEKKTHLVVPFIGQFDWILNIENKKLKPLYVHRYALEEAYSDEHFDALAARLSEIHARDPKAHIGLVLSALPDIWHFLKKASRSGCRWPSRA